MRVPTTGRPERLRTPPGPRREFSLEEMRANPLEFISGLVQRYGDVVRYHAAGLRATMLNDPRDVKRVLVDRFDNYVKEGTPDFLMLRPMLGNGLLTSDGTDWERQRRLLHPVFQRRHVDPLASGMTSVISEFIDEWSRDRVDTVVDMSREMSALTLRIVARALFSYDIREDVEGFAEAMDVLNEKTGHFGVEKGHGMEYAEALDVVRTVVYRIVIERLTADEAGHDTLGLLVESSQRSGDGEWGASELLDQVLTLLLAGHETTAKALSWTAFLLHTHPEAERRLVEEAGRTLGGRSPTVEDTNRMPWTWAVLQEALRLYPPIWLSSRFASADDNIRGFHIPAGTLVVFSPYLLHRRPDVWVEPDQFRPERFLEEGKIAASHSYLPFGGGARQCIGRQFASLELRLVLPMIYQRFHLELVEDHPVEPQALVTLRPAHGLPMRLRAR